LRTACAIAAAVAAAAYAATAGFGMPAGPEPANLAAVMAQVRDPPPDFELLLSYGTSKGASAGHLALAVNGETPGDAIVYSANYYADREPRHANDFHTADLMLRIPKTEYLYRTSSTLGPRASFGLDYGEVYKRTVLGVRVFGVPAAEREAVADYLKRINADFHARRHDTDYHRGEVKYSYMDLNCAKTIGSAFIYGAGYKDLSVREPPALQVRKLAQALNANTPSELAVQLLRAFHTRGYTMDAVIYRKFDASPYVDPHGDHPIAFKDLPNRFPSAISLDFRNDDGDYEDYNNLYAIALLKNLARYEVTVDDGSAALRIETTATPMRYAEAAAAADASAETESKTFLKRLIRRSP
jgi:hypothetical protein